VVNSSRKISAYCRSLGADHAINYRTQDFVAEVARITAKGGVDVVLDMVGGDYFPRNIEALAVEGRLVQIATLRGGKSEIVLPAIMQRRLTITGSTLRARSVAEKGAIARALLEHVWPLVEAGRVKPIVYRSFALGDAAAAHRLMESGEHIGKILLKSA